MYDVLGFNGPVMGESEDKEKSVGAWRAFAIEAAVLLASPGAEDLADMVRESDLPGLAECLRNTLAEQSATIAALRSDGERLQAKLATALALLTRYGGIDGAHHKDWAIDQAIRVMCGVPCGEHGIPGDATSEEYLRHVYEACKGDDGTPGEYEWSYGVAP